MQKFQRISEREIFESSCTVENSINQNHEFSQFSIVVVVVAFMSSSHMAFFREKRIEFFKKSCRSVEDWGSDSMCHRCDEILNLIWTWFWCRESCWHETNSLGIRMLLIGSALSQPYSMKMARNELIKWAHIWNGSHSDRTMDESGMSNILRYTLITMIHTHQRAVNT